MAFLKEKQALEQKAQQFLHEEAKTKLEVVIKKAIADSVLNSNFMDLLNETVSAEQIQIKNYFANFIHAKTDSIAAFIIDKQNSEILEKIEGKKKYELLLEKNEKIISEQQEKISILMARYEIDKKIEDERLTREQEEQKQREDESRLLEIKRKLALDHEREAIVNKNKKRSNLSFSLLASTVVQK